MEIIKICSCYHAQRSETFPTDHQQISHVHQSILSALPPLLLSFLNSNPGDSTNKTSDKAKGKFLSWRDRSLSSASFHFPLSSPAPKAKPLSTRFTLQKIHLHCHFTRKKHSRIPTPMARSSTKRGSVPAPPRTNHCKAPPHSKTPPPSTPYDLKLCSQTKTKKSRT